jgi:hypothetical protein
LPLSPLADVPDTEVELSPLYPLAPELTEDELSPELPPLPV